MKKHPWYIRPLAKLMSFILRSLKRTLKFRYSGLEYRDQALRMSPTGSFLVAIWHQDSVGSILAQSLRDYVVMVSKSADGELLAIPLSDIGFRYVRGSSRKGGKEAKDQMVDLVRKGIKASLTVDGPKGPPHQVKLGILEIARATGAPIMSSAVAYSRIKIFSKSWDQFRLPLPFSRVLFRFGPPLSIDPKLTLSDLAPFQEKLREQMFDQEKIAQEQMSHWNQLESHCP